MSLMLENVRFVYFAFGSNMLTKRVHINGSSARFISIGKLKDYKLSFFAVSPHHKGGTWHGAAATVESCAGASMWGVLYEIDEYQHAALDRQESVYDRISVSVETPCGHVIQCSTYQKKGAVDATADNRPSLVYKHVIIRGAKDHGLPSEYIDYLRQVEDNGYSGVVTVKGMEDAYKYIETEA